MRPENRGGTDEKKGVIFSEDVQDFEEKGCIEGLSASESDRECVGVDHKENQPNH